MKEKIKKELLSLADEKYKEFHRNLCPSENKTKNMIGIRIPVLRNYAKQLIKEQKIEELLSQIDDEYYEEIMLQGMLICFLKEDFKTVKKEIEKFIPKIDNWAICDTFCAGLKITKKYKNEMWKFIQKYLKSNQEFEIRFGIVMILDYYIEEEYLDSIFPIFDSITSKEYYVQMAIAWAICEALIKYYDKTLCYLENAHLDKFTYHKALQKALESYRISDDKKQILRKRKK